MTKPYQIGPIAPAPASKTTSTRGHRRPIPDDLLRDASRRLGIMSLVAAVLWIVASALGHFAVRLMSLGDPEWYRLDGGDAIAVVCVIVSLLLFTYTRQEGRNPRRIIDLGLGYMVFTAGALGLVFHWAVPAFGPCHLPPDFVDRRRRADVCRDRAEHAGQDLCRRLHRRLHESHRDAAGPC